MKDIAVTPEQISSAEKRALEMHYQIAIHSMMCETGLDFYVCKQWAECLCWLHPNSTMAVTKPSAKFGH